MARYPFGLSGPFEGLNLLRDGKVILDYKPNDKQLFMHNCMADEIFFGGSLGGGKSWAIVFHCGAHHIYYGKNARSIIFRRTYDELNKSIVPEFQELFDGKLGTLHASKPPEFRWESGGITYFRHMEKEEDKEQHASAQYSLVCFDELTHFTESQYLYFFQRKRSAKRGVHCQIIGASNPTGIGHRWVYERFIKDKNPCEFYTFIMPPQRFGRMMLPEIKLRRIFVPSKLSDNEALVMNNPEYLAGLRQSMSDDEWNARVNGDWTFFEGRMFMEWDPRVHVVDDFPIPKNWKVIRSMDPGYQSPFSVGWLAQDPETKAIYRISEWYGAKRKASGNATGITLAPLELRQGILDRELASRLNNQFPEPRFGVADPDLWRNDGGVRRADLVNQGSVLFRSASRTRGESGELNRVYRAMLFHSLLRMNPVTGLPGFMVFKSCKDFINQFPQLVRDEKNPEDVDTKQEDHIYDECGYGIVALTQGANDTSDSWEAQEMFRQAARMPVMY